jgi:3-dehydroquinate synthase
MYIDGTGYNIYIEKEGFDNLKEYISEKAKSKRLFILTDTNVYQHCASILFENIEQLKNAPCFTIQSGEKSKNMEKVMDLFHFLADNHANRDTILVCFGGGVVTDLGGFAASIYKRGIDTLLLPTSLLAQIDASIGGKTGIDANGIKNLIGSFYMPKGVFIFPGFLKSLPEREIKSGYAEAIKHALIDNKGYWNYLKEFDFTSYDRMIFKSIEIKDKLIDRDPKESGERKKLNFGHTIGHAIESYFLNQNAELVLHGEAVAAGMICESYISYKIQGLSEIELKEIIREIKKHFTKITIPDNSFEELKSYMLNDKKNSIYEINFTLLDAIGTSSFNRKADDTLIQESLLFYYQNG